MIMLLNTVQDSVAPKTYLGVQELENVWVNKEIGCSVNYLDLGYWWRIGRQAQHHHRTLLMD